MKVTDYIIKRRIQQQLAKQHIKVNVDNEWLFCKELLSILKTRNRNPFSKGTMVFKNKMLTGTRILYSDENYNEVTSRRCYKDLDTQG